MTQAMHYFPEANCPQRNEHYTMADCPRCGWQRSACQVCGAANSDHDGAAHDLAAVIAYDRDRAKREGPRHRCDGDCVCPVHGTPLIYAPNWGQHACQDRTCIHAHGMLDG